MADEAGNKMWRAAFEEPPFLNRYGGNSPKLSLREVSLAELITRETGIPSFEFWVPFLLVVLLYNFLWQL